MRFASAIFLIAIGAILTFAISVSDPTIGDVTISWNLVGWILMGLGALGLVLGFLATRSGETHTIERDRVIDR